MRYDLDGKVRVKMFGNVAHAAGAWHNGTRSADNIVVFCTEGEIRMQMESGVAHLSAGELLLIPQRTFYKPLEGGGCRYYFFHFEGQPSVCAAIQGVTEIAPHIGLFQGYGYTCIGLYSTVVEIEPQVMKASFAAREIFEKAAKLRPSKSFTDQLLLDHLLRELLIDMGRKSAPVRSDKLSAMLDFIETHYAEEISLSVISDHFGLSASYIARLFKRELGKRPSAYINCIRVSAARILLLETRLSVREIAERVGFSDLYYFSKVYKQIMGTAPSFVRKSLKRLDSEAD